LCIINAKEERDVAIIDIPNAFIQTWVEDRGYGNHQARFVDSLWIYLFRLLPMPTSLKSWLIRKGWNSYWYSARMPYMVQWLQASVLLQIHQESGECQIQN
jgi:hypothetical protein